MSANLEASWRRCWRGIGARSDGDTVRAAVLGAWREPHRRYHTLQHLGECITLFERVGALATHPAEVEVGLWFHDAVYDVERSTTRRAAPTGCARRPAPTASPPPSASASAR